MFSPHHRRSVRLSGFDYSSSGAYFVTICTHRMEHLFGRVADGEMALNAFGRIVENEWLRTADIRPYVFLDSFVVMPNHFHAIVWIVRDPFERDERDSCERRGVWPYAPTSRAETSRAETSRAETPFRSPSKNVGAIVRGFKSAVTKRVNEHRATPGVRVWQRNYHERIIRDEMALTSIREYIANNPLKWTLDEYFGN